MLNDYLVPKPQNIVSFIIYIVSCTSVPTYLGVGSLFSGKVTKEAGSNSGICIFLQACGFVEVVCGFFLLSDSKRILLSRLLASPESGLDQPPFYYLALALLVAGLAICATSALGCWATYMPGYAILTIVSKYNPTIDHQKKIQLEFQFVLIVDCSPVYY